MKKKRRSETLCESKRLCLYTSIPSAPFLTIAILNKKIGMHYTLSVSLAHKVFSLFMSWKMYTSSRETSNTLIISLYS